MSTFLSPIQVFKFHKKQYEYIKTILFIYSFIYYLFLFFLEPLRVNISTTRPSCPSCTDGSAVVIPLNGNSPFSFLWDDLSNTASVSRAAGNYSVGIPINKLKYKKK